MAKRSTICTRSISLECLYSSGKSFTAPSTR
jgi:hypothetical protein